jgi:hypothetical protein
MSWLHHHYEALGTIRALLEPVADGPEKGRIVYGEFLGPDTGAAGAGGWLPRKGPYCVRWIPRAARTATGWFGRAASG